MVSPQDTYEAGPNGNEVLGPNPGTNILTTNHIRSKEKDIFTWFRYNWRFLTSKDCNDVLGFCLAFVFD